MPMISHRRSRNTRNRTVQVIAAVLLAVIFYAFFAFFSPRVLTVPGGFIAQLSSSAGSSVSVFSRSFTDQMALVSERDALRNEVHILETRLAAQSYVVSENRELRALFGYVSEGNTLITSDSEEGLSGTLARVLARPPRTPYDTLVLDKGSDEGIALGDLVFGPGGFLIGTVEEVSQFGSLARLLSAPGRETDGFIGDARAPITIEGQGGGSFIATLPKDSTVAPGDKVHSLPHNGAPVAVVREIVRKEREATIQVLFPLAVNFFETGWVRIVRP